MGTFYKQFSVIGEIFFTATSNAFRMQPTVNVYIFAQLHFRGSSPIERILIFAHMPLNSICSIMIIIFTHIKFSRIYGPARNARKYVLRENFYVYSIYIFGPGGFQHIGFKYGFWG